MAPLFFLSEGYKRSHKMDLNRIGNSNRSRCSAIEDTLVFIGSTVNLACPTFQGGGHARKKHKGHN